MGGINGIFGNSYGIDKHEFKQIKKELKAYNKDKDSTNDISKTELKEMEAAIKNNKLEEYLDKCSANMKSALGLALVGAVDKGGFAQAVKMADMFKGAKKEKIEAHLKADYAQGVPKSVEAEYQLKLLNHFQLTTAWNMAYNAPETEKTSIANSIHDFEAAFAS